MSVQALFFIHPEVKLDITIITYLVILCFALYLFVREPFPIEIAALGIAVLLTVTGILSQAELRQSFANEAVFLIGAVFVLLAGMTETGVILKLEKALLKLTRGSESKGFFLVLVFFGLASSFIGNTVLIALGMPIVIAISSSYSRGPKQWLLPMSFAVVLGGMNSLLGTSSNIVISGMLPQYGLEPFSLFTTGYVGFPIFLVGLAYLWILSKKLLPVSEGEFQLERVDVKYNLRAYTTEVVVIEGSPLCYKTIDSASVLRDSDLVILSVSRDQLRNISPRGGFILEPGDVLLLEGNISKLNELKDRCGLRFIEQVKQKERGVRPDTESLDLHEVVITNSSQLKFRTPAEISLRNRYRISLLAVHRQGETIRDSLKNLKLLAGDILIVQFLSSIDNRLLEQLGLVPLQIVPSALESGKPYKAILAVAIFILSILVGSLTSMGLTLASLLGAVALVAFRVLDYEKLYSHIEWRILIFIGSVIALGKGMESSGAAVALSGLISEFLTGHSPYMVLFTFLGLATLLTQILSNQAAAALLIPLAVNTAVTMGISKMSLVMAVTVGASLTYLTPFEPGFMLVYGPGQYRFMDFVRVGLPLTLIGLALSMLLIPYFWGF